MRISNITHTQTLTTALCDQLCSNLTRVEKLTKAAQCNMRHQHKCQKLKKIKIKAKKVHIWTANLLENRLKPSLWTGFARYLFELFRVVEGVNLDKSAECQRFLWRELCLQYLLDLFPVSWLQRRVPQVCDDRQLHNANTEFYTVLPTHIHCRGPIFKKS